MTVRKYSAETFRLQGGFTAVPNVVLRSGDLSGNAKALYAIMLDLAWREAEPEMGELATAIGVTEKTCRKAIRELQDVELVGVRRRGLGLTNAYIVNEPRVDRNGKFSRSGTAESPDPSLPEDVEEQDDVGAKAPPSAGVAKARKRNPVFDALVEATHANPADGGMIGKASKAIREAMEPTIRDLREGYLSQNPDADEVPAEIADELVAGQIRIRADLYRQLRPEWELTPTALAKHWNRITTWQPKGMRPADIAKLRDEDFGVG